MSEILYLNDKSLKKLTLIEIAGPEMKYKTLAMNSKIKKVHLSVFHLY